ncbi:glycerate kinase [Paenibacillus sp. MBLB4367]|uniref:glycerate kinase n=1 Tax=Paenibacillus sp. MBLB4367 TaxID=3384767 RepID=UPI0039083A06
MHIIIAPDSYKGSLSALQAAKAIREGVLRAAPDAKTELVPMADGGEGFTEALAAAMDGTIVETDAHDPLGRQIRGFYAFAEATKTAVIECAAASGLTLLTDAERNPLRASTFGTGELIKAALDRGCERVLLGLGGSATNDGGIGMAQALGFRFLDAAGQVIPAFSDGWLEVAAIDSSGADPRLAGVRFIAACDVDAPLYGERGASAVFGPQKGASKEDVARLDTALRQLAVCMTRDIRVDVHALPGGGAAGGLGAGLYAFCGASMQKGVDLVLDACRFEERLPGASFVLTGEGRTDEQTAMGKTAAGIALRAGKYRVPVICLSGGLTGDYTKLHEHGIDACFSIMPHPASLEEAIAHAEPWLADAAEQVARLFAVARHG